MSHTCQTPTKCIGVVRIYSITSSATASNVLGKGTSIALDVFKLTINSNRVGCSTGMFSGLAPRKSHQ